MGVADARPPIGLPATGSGSGPVIARSAIGDTRRIRPIQTMAESARNEPGRADDDPRPVEPVQPDLDDCCGNGCTPCIFDLYDERREAYHAALRAWRERQDRRAADAGRPVGPDVD